MRCERAKADSPCCAAAMIDAVCSMTPELEMASTGVSGLWITLCGHVEASKQVLRLAADVCSVGEDCLCFCQGQLGQAFGYTWTDLWRPAPS